MNLLLDTSRFAILTIIAWVFAAAGIAITSIVGHRRTVGQD